MKKKICFEKLKNQICPEICIKPGECPQYTYVNQFFFFHSEVLSQKQEKIKISFFHKSEIINFYRFLSLSFIELQISIHFFRVEYFSEFFRKRNLLQKIE